MEPDRSLACKPAQGPILRGSQERTPAYGGGGKAPKAPRGREGPSALPANRLAELLRAEKPTLPLPLHGKRTLLGAEAPRCGDPLRGSFTRTSYFTSEYQNKYQILLRKIENKK